LKASGRAWITVLDQVTPELMDIAQRMDCHRRVLKRAGHAIHVTATGLCMRNELIR
jgi:hypothetical protein